jgi:hypothetical protein
MTARWHLGPVSGLSYWRALATSPETLVFAFFMITDPKTLPRSARSRVLFGTAVGFLSALLAAPANSEFATKVAVLGGLAVTSAALPVLAGLGPRLAGWWARLGRGSKAGLGLGSLGLSAVALVLATATGTDGVEASAIPARPAVTIDPTSIPEPTIDGEVREIDASVTIDRARRMAHDLVADLMIEADALAHRDASLATAASLGPRLARTRDLIAAGGTTESPLRYRFTSLRVVVVRDPANPQASPELGIDAHGAASAPGTPQVAIRRVFVLTRVQGSHLIADDVEPLS